MRHVPALGLVTAALVALAGCTGTNTTPTPTPSASASASASAPAKVYSEDELRQLISGLRDRDGNELRLYSKDQVDQGGRLAEQLLGTATVDPAACKDLATAGLLDSVESGSVAVAISDSQQPRTLSAQSGSDGPDAVALLDKVSGTMDQCGTFKVSLLGQTYEVSSQELQADTQADVTFGTLSTRSGDPGQQLMQVSAAEGRLLVVATKGGSGLGDNDRQELEGLINQVLQRASGGGGSSASPTSTAMPTSSPSASPSRTATTGTSASATAGLPTPSASSTP